MGVIVVGAGPTGLLLAGDLARDGIPVTVLERRTEESNLTRAFALHARSLELLDMRGLADGLVAGGSPVPEVRITLDDGGTAALDMRHPESRFPFVLVLAQARTEAALLRRARDLGVEIVHGAEVDRIAQGAASVTVGTAGGAEYTADYAVGCDGAHSSVRRLIGAEFAGRSYPTRILLADVRLDRSLPRAILPVLGRDGVALLPPYGDGWYRAIVWDRRTQDVPDDAPLTIGDLRDSLIRIAGSALGLAEMGWSTRFLSERRQADRYREGRVLLAGDAAHVHSPVGGMGMSTGLQDAANLSWRLTAQLRGWAPPWLLDSYETERHPVGRTALRLTDALNTLVNGPAAIRAVRPRLVPRMLSVPGVARGIRRTMSSLGVHYPAPPGVEETPSIGRRVPDLPLSGDGVPERLYELARSGRFVLVDASPAGAAAPAAAAWSDRVDAVRTGPLGLSTMDTLLIRPDGYLAWSAADPDAHAVRAALRAWTGAPADAVGPAADGAGPAL
ncbi:FAD-dependent monooxygenase [Nocardiopsis coralliicola]